jgi:hypothetical protein
VSGGVLVGKGAAGRTLSTETPPETPPKTPPPNARAGREPQNPRTHPPSPPEGGSGTDQLVVEETYLTERGRRRQRPIAVDLAAVRERLRAAGKEDLATWAQIRELLLEAVGESTFAIWLDPLQLVAVDPDGTLLVAVPEQTGGWVRAHFARVLVSAADRAGRAVRFANEVERRAFARLPPAAGTPGQPASPAGSLARQSPSQRVSPRGAGSVIRQTDRSSDGRADASGYRSSYTDVYTQTREVSQ